MNLPTFRILKYHLEPTYYTLVLLLEGLQMQPKDYFKDTLMDDTLYKIRHSLAHVLAQAVKLQFPNAQLGFGPATDEGFFYDFDLGEHTLVESDLKKLEKSMKKIVRSGQTFDYTEMDRDQAITFCKEKGEHYKIENIENLASQGVEKFSFYTNGEFSDLCEGPHVEKTSNLPEHAFKLDRLAGAYWLGDEKNKMLTRIYGVAFETRDELDAFFKRRLEAEKRDHKKLGKDLDLYHQHDLIGKGLILWLPHGTIIRDEIENFAKEVETKAGYQRVSTPHIAKEDLYLKSQHLPAYKESMFPPMVDEEHGTKFYLKPMNCPHHHLIYSARLRSYRDLPLRLAEYGTCYRYEQSGELSGLLRVRCMTLNDAHIYLRKDQFAEEFKSIIKMYQHFYDVFGITSDMYHYRLSVRGEGEDQKFKGEAELWAESEKMLEDSMKELGLSYEVGKGEGAFYGPKIDIQFKNLLGREETVSTIQVDFLSPQNFELRFIGEDGSDEQPVIIHRSPLSTHERFISYLIELYGGAFPMWMAPVQAAVVPVSPEYEAYGKSIVDELKEKGFRAKLDDSENSLNKKIRTNTVQKIPQILIVGEKERTDKTVTVRSYGVKDQETILFSKQIEHMTKAVKERSR